jgi:mRNA interferase MazF
VSPHPRERFRLGVLQINGNYDLCRGTDRTGGNVSILWIISHCLHLLVRNNNHSFRKCFRQFDNEMLCLRLPRPAVVISNDLRNDFSNSVLAIPISDAERGANPLPTHVFLLKGTGGLTKDSRALCEQVASLEKDCFVEGPIGKLASTTLNALVQALNRAVSD